MSTMIVFEDGGFAHLLPLVYWRAVFDLRLGFDTLLDKVRRTWGPARLQLFVRDYLADTVRETHGLVVNAAVQGETLFVNGRLMVGRPLDLPINTVLQMHNEVAAVHLDAERSARMSPAVFLDPSRLAGELHGLPCQSHEQTSDLKLLSWPWDFVHANAGELLRQFRTQFGKGGIEGQVYQGAYLLNREAIHIGPGSKVMPCVVLDAEQGPIYIGANVRISPHVSVQGPCYIGDHSVIQSGASIREATSIGPVCKVGGEIEGSIIHSYSNKQHDGFLGHAYLGQWINIAADAVNSDLKNTYGRVRVPINGVEVDSGEMFVGLTVGDHSKCGINSSFATGSVVGFSANLFMSAHIPKFVPSFAWYTDSCRERYDADRGLDIARKVMARRKVTMTLAQEQLYRRVMEEALRHERVDLADKAVRE
jgi:UDP-N-acetylglucosamine diphosphorylase / glucose-1-phosphate thymidylyltransferase / UDP-N-acetylgalactosamine diphosphorylase / glucosamine-1-phosphate N-acetyltransferase / galactosamine-1-phosphate N-acetyltransferase